jgi:hypothetical protein
MSEPQASIEQPSGQWVNQLRWPALGAHPERVALGNGDGTTGTLGGHAGGSRTFSDDPALTEAQAGGRSEHREGRAAGVPEFPADSSGAHLRLTVGHPARAGGQADERAVGTPGRLRHAATRRLPGAGGGHRHAVERVVLG